MHSKKLCWNFLEHEHRSTYIEPQENLNKFQELENMKGIFFLSQRIAKS